MTLYWDTVLNEILNKKDRENSYSMTRIRDLDKHLIQENHSIFEEKKKNFCTKKNYKKYFLGGEYPNIYFTEREAETMIYFIQGKTTGQVALILKLSPRTVEFYLKNMKIKLKCRLKSELILKVVASDFMQRYIHCTSKCELI